VRTTSIGHRTAIGPALLAALLLLLPAALFAQDFGRNKVSYKVIDFSVLSTDHFRIFHYPREAPPVLDAGHLLERWYASHADLFGFGLAQPQKVMLYDSFADFQQTYAVPGLISPGEGGVTESAGGRIILALTGVPSDDAHVLGHELVHAFQFQALKSAGIGPGGGSSLPTWLVEGMAEYLSLGPDDPLTAMWMRDALLNGAVPGIEDLAGRPDLYFPYRFGAAMWAFIERRVGRTGVRSFFTESVAHGVESADVSVLKATKTADLDAVWKEDAMSVYGPLTSGRARPREVGRTLTAFGGRTNLGPSISPDGRTIAVFSRVDPFSLSLALVDAASGREVGKLGGTGSDRSFDALHFINASGGWSPDGRRFAFPVDRGGHSAIALAEVPSGRIERVIPVPEVADISGLAWSPGGDRLALSGTRDAMAGLWLLDLADGTLAPLTQGRGAYLQPAWSPDGATLAFATDYGPRTDREALVYGSMNIGLMDVASRGIRVLSIKDGTVHVDPQFAPDGRSLFFVASPDGVPDVYRYGLDSGTFYRVTRVATGVSGLTSLSPCLSVALGSGDLAFTLFSRRDYEVHVLPAAEAAGTEVSFDGAIPLPAAVSDTPVAAAPAGPVRPYRPTFELLSASAANVGVSVDNFGAAVGGSAELTFQDLVGDHLIDVAAQVNGTIETVGGQVFYLNTRRRVAWGIGAAHLPQFVYSFATVLPPADTAIAQQLRFTELVEAQAFYPFSANRRLEAGLSYSHIWWNPSAAVYYFQNGSQIGQGVQNLPVPAALDLVHAGIAYVGDYSFFGFTEPLTGYRYRFDAGGDAGSLFFLTLAADIRAYLYLKPFGFAFRAMETGRWFGDADSSSLYDYYLGDPTLVRGYEYYSMVANEGAGAANVPQINRLFGSKVAVVKAEIRLPLLGNGDVGLVSFPWLPTTLVGFFDAGVAWTGSDYPLLTWSTDPSGRIPVFSAGGAVRFNLFNAAVLEIYFAWPFQRPGINGSWGFLVSAGW
jgi:hypothetical protein